MMILWSLEYTISGSDESASCCSRQSVAFAWIEKLATKQLAMKSDMSHGGISVSENSTKHSTSKASQSIYCPELTKNNNKI